MISPNLHHWIQEQIAHQALLLLQNMKDIRFNMSK